MKGLKLQDEVAERRVIGLMFSGVEGAVDVLRDLRPEHFTIVELRRLFETASEAGRPSPDAVVHMLEEKGESGKTYRAVVRRCLRDSEGTTHDLHYYADRLRLRLRARSVFRELDGVGGDPGVVGLLQEDRVDEAIERLRNYATASAVDWGGVDQGDWLDNFEQRRARIRDMQRHPEKYQGIVTGIDELDRRTGGVRPQELAMIVGETGAGKTSSLVHLAFEAYCQAKRVVYVTIEVPRLDIEFMLDARLSGLNRAAFRAAHLEGRLPPEDQKAWRIAVKKQRRSRAGRIWVVDLPEHCTAIDIEGHVSAAEAKLGERFDLIVVDHLTLMSPVAKVNEDRLGWKSVGEVSNDLKFLGRRAKKTIWVGVQGRDGRIGLSYLAAQPADLIVVIDRDEEEYQETGRVRLRIEKSRWGGKKVIQVEFDYATCEIRSVRRDEGE